MEKHGHVLVIGAATLDVKGRPTQKPARGSSTPGQIRITPGGVARNIAENLTRLDVETILLTAVGDDETGERILGEAAGSGIDISEALVVEDRSSGVYVALLDEHGALHVGVDDLGITETLTPAYFETRRVLFEGASAVALDANLTPDALATVVRLAQQAGAPICADPVSTSLAERLRPHLPACALVSPNLLEARALCGGALPGADHDAAMAAAAHLVGLGVQTATVALAEFGVVYAARETRGHIPALQTPIVDPTGAGDAMTAAIIFGLREGIPIDECVRLGVTAASLTLRSAETVRSDLSVDLLYDELAG
jgi:pseudouridine kinase